jgi:hypothetical protein
VKIITKLMKIITKLIPPVWWMWVVFLVGLGLGLLLWRVGR